MSLEPDDYIMNKYTGRTLKKGSRAYTTYIKKLRREVEDKALIDSVKKQVKKKTVLKHAGLDSDDDDMPPSPPKLVRQTGKIRRSEISAKKNMKEAFSLFNDTCATIGPDADEAEIQNKFETMFRELGLEE